MPTILPFVRKSTKKDCKHSKIRFRIMNGRACDVFFVSDLSVNFDNWDSKRACLKSKIAIDPIQRNSIESGLMLWKSRIMQAFESLEKQGIKPTSKALKNEMDFILNPDKKTLEKSFFEYFDTFVNHSNIGHFRKRFYVVLRNIFERFEIYKQISDKNFSLDIEKFTMEMATDFVKFLENEHEISKSHKDIYEKKTIEQRGANTVCCKTKGAIAFFNYLVKYGHINRSPFANVEYSKEVYGTPFYLTIDERNRLYQYDLSDKPELERQRDIFVFHCVIGCRVGDLMRLTKSNVVNGGVEYIAGKTKDGNPKTIRVPLNSVGLEILEKYSDLEGVKLLPFISEQKYNDAIKKALKTAEINRIVTIMDSKTRRDKQVPIYEVASSHLARRTLYANVYKKFKDPALAGSLTGHSPNSKAALRYRDIDEDIKLELVRSLE